MSATDAATEFDDAIDKPVSVEIARGIIERQLAWLAWVPEHEFTAGEHVKLMRAYRNLYAVLRPLTEKYID